MSAIAGIYNFDQRPVNERVLAALGDGLSAHATDGGGEVCSTSVGFAYRAFHTNWESRAEIQPLITRCKQILAWDGRLDNREELISKLRHLLEHDRTDVAIVTAAYLEWSVGFLTKLTGEFALALWDPIERRLLLARDPVGTRPLYFHLDNERIVWSSELLPLLDHAGIPVEVDDEYVAGYLAHEPDPWLTPYKHIRALPPANALHVQGDRVSEFEFWKLNPDATVRYKTDAEYEDHFRHLFREAVGCRLRTDGPAWAELSGGLDSSAIVCMADDLIGRGEVQATKLRTVSQVFDESAESDERRFIQCVEAQRGIPGLHLREDDFRLLASITDKSHGYDLNPFRYTAAFHRALYEAMSEDGARVVLSGRGGDEMLNSSMDPSPELSDLLFELRIRDLHRRLQVWSSTLKQPYLKVFWQSAMTPLLPAQIQLGFKRKGKFALPRWLDAQFASRMHMRERMLITKDIYGCRRPSSRDQAIGFISVVRGFATGYRREIAGVEVSFPFTHLPLVEFLQAIPFDQRVRPGEARSLMRRSLRTLLPRKVVARKGKGRPGGAISRAFVREWATISELFEDSRVCARGYVDPTALHQEIERICHGSGAHSVPLVKAIVLEVWLRSLEENGASTNRKAARAAA